MHATFEGVEVGWLGPCCAKPVLTKFSMSVPLLIAISTPIAILNLEFTEISVNFKSDLD